MKGTDSCKKPQDSPGRMQPGPQPAPRAASNFGGSHRRPTQARQRPAPAASGIGVLDRPAPPADARIAYGKHEQQFGDLRMPAGSGPHPLVIMIHGGYWRARYDLEHTGHFCAALTAAGVATWNIEYRRLGQGGGWPTTFHDVARAVDFARQLAQAYPLELSRVVLVGHSAGGQLALWAAGRSKLPPGSAISSAAPLPLRAVIALAAVCDLRLAWEMQLSNGVAEQFLGGTPAQVAERYAQASPTALLPLGVRQILIHGSSDTAVPPLLSERYHAAAAARRDDVQLIQLAGTNHFAPIDPTTQEWLLVQQQILRQLQ